MSLKRTFMIGSVIGLLNVVVTNIYIADRPIGASTSYPYLAGMLFNLQGSTYFHNIDAEGSWELCFLIGAFIGALIGAFLFKHFEIQTVPDLWAQLKGPSKIKRICWSFFGGFILILGARLADGCTSGHILSGGMELAVSSLVFALFVLLSLLITARYFYESNT